MMRMHSYGKCSPNLVVGALLVFSLIVLYNYWNVSAFNKDLLLQLHTLEQQAIALAKANDAIRSNYDKSETQKSKVEEALLEEQKAEEIIKTRLSEKESMIKKYESEIQILKKENKKAHDELAKVKQILVDRDSQVVKLTAQIKEKEISLAKVEKLLSAATASKSPAASSAPTKPIEDSLQPVLMNDPAEQQMNPEVAAPKGPGNTQEKALDELNNGGEVNNNNEPAVLPVPGGNLDAAEDDGDVNHQVKDDGQGHADQQDHDDQADQSPDGALNPKEKEQRAVVPPPPAAGAENHPGEDNREAAHLQDISLNNGL